MDWLKEGDLIIDLIIIFISEINRCNTLFMKIGFKARLYKIIFHNNGKQTPTAQANSPGCPHRYED